jgi:hypothetical protein
MVVNKQPIQRRCDKCIRATYQYNGSFCRLYCTMKREAVSKFDHCDRFFYGKFDKRWIK